jgi:hypothetical protein
MGKKGKSHLHNVAMFALSSTILLMRMGVGNSMRDVNAVKKGIKLLIFPTPIGLDSNDLAIKSSFNQALNSWKYLNTSDLAQSK